ncbi:SGNH/GDSL hydrolase family protein [Gimesia chilikensis]|uniref:SGNH/GDSL hydrolase family protein n=1 Tax=Gimesia chilikensis TaxID=2605989 RepID=UPI0011A0695D|nr:SGNH/GDSL hydrolase family protein [Gimesia chilikensis]
MQNLLQNPQFGLRHSAGSDPERSILCWNTDRWGDVIGGSGEGKFNLNSSAKAVEILPGKRIWQFATLPELGLKGGDAVSLSVNGYQEQSGALKARLCLMLIESADGQWSPADFGMPDKRTFAKHGRGELVRSPQQETSSQVTGKEFSLQLNGLKIDPRFKEQRESDAAFRNVVGVLVEFVNDSDQRVWVNSPVLVKGKSAAKTAPTTSRALPNLYQKIPRTMQKLTTGQPISILTLGSSIDRGSANPRLYFYDEDPASPHYKEPLIEARPGTPTAMKRLIAERMGRPDLQDYVGWSQHYFMYTGRLRRELLRKFHYPVEKMLLNVMACDGSSIGESHSGFKAYAELELPPNPNENGHPTGKSWQELYPALFENGKKPVPDLVIFGHGHNEHIDRPDEIAVYEGAIRWFQRHYPGVEFVSCMWIRDKGSANSMTEPMQELCEHYGIPFVDMGQLIIDLKATTNYFAMAPDGGHPAAGSHYLWFKQLEQVFEMPAEATLPGVPQKQLPPRMNAYARNWEGTMVRFEKDDTRLVDGRMMILEDAAFNLWADNKREMMQLLIDGQPAENAGHGRHSFSVPNPRNSTFVHGRLARGDRHIIEIPNPGARLSAVDCKVGLKRRFYGVEAQGWQGKSAVENFESKWGAPYGEQAFLLQPGEALEIEVEADELSIAWLDDPAGGTLVAEVDGKPAWSQPTNQPFTDSQGRTHFIENRRGVLGLPFGKHRIRLQAEGKPVRVIGVFGYDGR